MKKNILKFGLLVALAAMPAMSAPLPSNLVGTWLSFGWSAGIGSHATGGFAAYTGSLGTTVASTGSCVNFATDVINCGFSGAYTVNITDLFFDGDQFALYDNGILIGTTSVATNDFTTCGDDPAACTGSKWTHGSFALGSGNHQLDIVLIGQTSGISSGKAAFNFNGAASGTAPEPATFGLIGLGLVGVALRLRKNRA